jgi:putative ABC transport system substrate-binding protein
VKSVTAAGEKLGVALHMMPVRNAEDFDRVFAEMVEERVDGFLDIASPLTVARRAALAELALKHRLAGIFGLKIYVEAGGLMSYGADFNDLHRRAAAYIDKILKGANPGDLPVIGRGHQSLVL